MPYYLGNQIQYENINLLSNTINQNIIKLIKDATYYSFILDTVPDLSHADRMSIIIDFIFSNSEKYL